MKTKWPAIGLACALLASGSLLASRIQQEPQSSDDHSAAVVHTTPARISRVVLTAQGDAPRVEITGDGDFHYRATRLEKPCRLVLDFADTTLVSSASSIPGNEDLVRAVRLGQFQPDVARVVVELDHWAPYNFVTSKTGLIIEFSSAKHDAAESTSTAAAKPAQSQLPLPTWLTGTSASLATPAEPLPPAPALQQQGQTPAPNPPQQQAGSAMPSPAVVNPVRYTGEPLGLDLKDVDVLDFFRLIHEISGLNVVVDPAVKGTVTLDLRDVPWDQALDIVLKNNGLDQQLEGNVLRIASKSTLKAEAEAAADLQKANSDAEELVTVTKRLSYAKATMQAGAVSGGKAQLGKGMDELLRPFLSHRGSIFGDARTNTLIIRDTPSAIAKIDDLLRQLDRKSQQVEIEARVVLASRSFAQDIGTQFGIQGTAGNNQIGGVQSILPPTTSSSTSTVGNVLIPLNSNLGATSPISGLSFANITPNFGVDILITAAESKGVGKLLSAPKIFAQNNSEGMVEQGTQIPIQTNINNTISTQYITAALILRVTPQITADGTILMVVHVENTSIDSGIPAILGQPALATQSVDTQVLARDGQTVVLGGVIVDQQNTQINEVPLLGSVPLIGDLFKHRTVSVQSQELLFFLTPRVSQD
jgi:type IV pilus secretin PilQ/predicted competence protein